MIKIFGVAKYSPEKDAPAYLIEIPDLELSTQAETLDDVIPITKDMLELMFEEVGIESFKIEWENKEGGSFSIGTESVTELLAFIMRQKRMKSGVTLSKLSENLGFSSHNSIAAYEQASRSPSVEKFSEIAEGLGYELVISLKKKIIVIENA